MSNDNWGWRRRGLTSTPPPLGYSRDAFRLRDLLQSLETDVSFAGLDNQSSISSSSSSIENNRSRDIGIIGNQRRSYHPRNMMPIRTMYSTRSCEQSDTYSPAPASQNLGSECDSSMKDGDFLSNFGSPTSGSRQSRDSIASHSLCRNQCGTPSSSSSNYDCPRVPTLFQEPFRRQLEAFDDNLDSLPAINEKLNESSGSWRVETLPPTKLKVYHHSQFNYKCILRRGRSNDPSHMVDMPWIQLPVQSHEPHPFALQWDDLRPKLSANPEFSRKVFIGGIPENTSERDIYFAFGMWGQIDIDWPSVEDFKRKKMGYCYVIFDSPETVYELLNSIQENIERDELGRWRMTIYHHLSARAPRSVQIIPWDINNNYYACTLETTVFPEFFVVFVGGLHGKTTAHDLFGVMFTLFQDDVCFVVLDVDKNFYPLGTARVAFKTWKSYAAAIKLHYVCVHAKRMERKLQIEPFILPMQKCYRCVSEPGIFICRHRNCLRYVCMDCFRRDHSTEDVIKDLGNHRMVFKAPNKVQKSVSDATLSSIYLEFYHTGVVS